MDLGSPNSDLQAGFLPVAFERMVFQSKPRYYHLIVAPIKIHQRNTPSLSAPSSPHYQVQLNLCGKSVDYKTDIEHPEGSRNIAKALLTSQVRFEDFFLKSPFMHLAAASKPDQNKAFWESLVENINSTQCELLCLSVKTPNVGGLSISGILSKTLIRLLLSVFKLDDKDFHKKSKETIGRLLRWRKYKKDKNGEERPSLGKKEQKAMLKLLFDAVEPRSILHEYKFLHPLIHPFILELTRKELDQLQGILTTNLFDSSKKSKLGPRMAIVYLHILGRVAQAQRASPELRFKIGEKLLNIAFGREEVHIKSKEVDGEDGPKKEAEAENQPESSLSGTQEQIKKCAMDALHLILSSKYSPEFISLLSNHIIQNSSDFTAKPETLKVFKDIKMATKKYTGGSPHQECILRSYGEGFPVSSAGENVQTLLELVKGAKEGEEEEQTDLWRFFTSSVVLERYPPFNYDGLFNKLLDEVVQVFAETIDMELEPEGEEEDEDDESGGEGEECKMEVDQVQDDNDLEVVYDDKQDSSTTTLPKKRTKLNSAQIKKLQTDMIANWDLEESMSLDEATEECIEIMDGAQAEVFGIKQHMNEEERDNSPSKNGENQPDSPHVGTRDQITKSAMDFRIHSDLTAYRIIFVLFLLLNKAFVEVTSSQNICITTAWNIREPSCPPGYIEICRDVHHTVQSFTCCKEGKEYSMTIERLPYGCRSTPCLSLKSVSDICSFFMDRFVDQGKVQLKYELVLSESCPSDGGPRGTGVCCVEDSIESFISATMAAEKNEFPHHANVISGSFFCGGTIYNSKYVITAAHCLVTEQTGDILDKSSFQIVLGSNIQDVQVRDFTYGVKRFLIYPGYSGLKGDDGMRINRQGTYGDVALIELNRTIQFGPKVKALRIAPKDFVPSDYSIKAVIIGWGTNHYSTTTSVFIQKANYLFRSDYSCFEEGPAIYRKHAEKADELMCLGGIVNKTWGPTAGHGDSGGPVICRGSDGRALLCGVVSFGGPDIECKMKSDDSSCTPTVVAEVSHFNTWFRNHAGDQDLYTLYSPWLYGESIHRTEEPHQVRISSNGGAVCGGTLIAPNIVVTACHCVMNETSMDRYNNITVKTGFQHIPFHRHTFTVMTIFTHPNFARSGPRMDQRGSRQLAMENFHTADIAILVLDGGVSFPTKFPKLPTSIDDVSSTSFESAYPRNLNLSNSLKITRREIILLDLEDCKARISRLSVIGLHFSIDSRILCGMEKYSGGSTCDDVVGGGLICRNRGQSVLCGVSFFRFCEFASPIFFVNVYQYAEFLQSARNIIEQEY